MSLVVLGVVLPLTISFPFPVTFISRKSLSVMTIFLEVIVPKVTQEDGEEIVKMAVSSPSVSVSSTTVNVTEPVVFPSEIVIVVLLNI